MAREGSPTSYDKLIEMYTRCHGLEVDALTLHRCPRTVPSAPTIKPKVQPEVKPKVKPVSTLRGHNIWTAIRDLVEVVVGSIAVGFAVAILKATIPYVLLLLRFIIQKYRGFLEWLRHKLGPQTGTPNEGISGSMEMTEVVPQHCVEIDEHYVYDEEIPLFAFGSSSEIPESNAAGVVWERLTEPVKCLLEAGTHVNTRDQDGRIPIQLAALYGTSEDVEILFPFTSPIPEVVTWTVDGIISHMKLERKRLENDEQVEMRSHELKKLGDDAFKKNDYVNVSAFYTQALLASRYDAVLFSNRSLCWLRRGDGKKALQDAVRCRRLQPEWVKGYFREAQALMFLKEYKKARVRIAKGLEMDPSDPDLNRLHWDAKAAEMMDDSTEAAAWSDDGQLRTGTFCCI